MHHSREQELAAKAFNATRFEDQPDFELCSQQFKTELYAKIKSVEHHGAHEDDPFEVEVARLLAAETDDQWSKRRAAAAAKSVEPPSVPTGPLAPVKPSFAAGVPVVDNKSATGTIIASAKTTVPAKDTLKK